MLSKRQILIVVILLVLSPVFGIWLTSITGYEEPLDKAAATLNLTEWENFNWTPLKDYTVPGLPDWLGYIATGVLGVVVILLIGYLMKMFAVRRR